MVSEHPLPSSNRSPKLSSNSSFFTTRIFSDVAGDITIVVHEESFLLHKFPLVARSGRIRKLIASFDKDSGVSMLEFPEFPGLRCAADFLEMTEDYREDNLVSRTEAFLDEVVCQSLEKSVEVLTSCESLGPMAEEVGIVKKCVEAIAMNACKEQLVSGLSRLECDDRSSEFKGGCLDWWVEDLSSLGIESYQRVIRAMGGLGIRPDSIIMSLMHYGQNSLKGAGRGQIWSLSRMKPDRGFGDRDQRKVVETLVTLMPSDKNSSVPLSFLFGLLRMAIMVDADVSCRLELERRISFRLEMVSLDDLLIPSVRPGDSLFDIDTVHRILVNYLQRMEEEEENVANSEYESDMLNSPGHGSLLKVGRLIDAYLAEIAPDPYLSLQKFSAMIEILPDYARVIDDALYRAVDIYLKAHPLTEHECKKLCKFIDCQKLSQEACNHAAQNDRLPLQMTVRVLYFEQLRLKTAFSGSSGDGFFSQKMSSGIPSAPMSPRDNYASLRRENRELKLEISRMRVRLSELEKEQRVMKQGMMDKAGNGKTLLNSISRGFGRIGIFGTQSSRKRQKPGRKSRSRRHSVS
ncbi:BTB/POZ domain-containing protein At3g08570 isoform X2 [Punica granatum]|uniref:BTB/POZ domain-containing protein At3g08570 isoform X2 n=1 Tax=Punica granatum TaxID=22663 RepID=A0A6P8C4H4_PUNGR|nr:BTB/POZ domain-containing protein At3g08570 isoform X2 [Punica granatum]